MSIKITGVLLLLTSLLKSGKSTCTPASLDGGKYGVKLDGNGTDNNGNLNSGATWATVTVKCLSTGFTFSNGVRRVPDVDVDTVDTDQRIVVQCGVDGAWHPNIWYKYSATGVPDTSQLRYTYCSPGCHMLPRYSYKVTYPPGLVTSEEYSAPVQPNAELYVSLRCGNGYTEAVGDTGYKTLQCKQKVSTGGSGLDVEWSVDENNRLTCVRGCKDITESVQYGETTASSSKVADGPPFVPGDIIPFSCKNGYRLVGHSKLTCRGDNTWSEEIPECVSALVTSSADSPHLETHYIMTITFVWFAQFMIRKH
ncbi:uncharacterized protein LOC134826317 [Bolinopsis microptera]|uniref:uncharacterized protein LOC134826317 n=1 Tax=Bolinopsis microptera TaxID=2820187 RepID=UPI00307AF5D4